MSRAIRFALVEAARFVHVRDFLEAIKATDLFASLVTSPRFRDGMTTIGREAYVAIDCLEWLASREDVPSDLKLRVETFLTSMQQAAS